jgi:murein DD-endopeptidase MepM/ murein hydrolase activator NlpD
VKTSLPRRQRAVAAALAALLLLTGTLPFAASAAGDPWGRQKDDPIAVARQQREKLHGRIENQAQRLKRLQASSRQLHDRMGRTKAKLADISSSIEEVEAEVVAAEADLALTEAQHAELVDQVSLLDWSLDQLSAQADELAADLKDRKAALGQRLAEAYRTGQTPMWQQVLGAGSFVDVVITQDGLVDYAQHDQQVAEGIREDQHALDVRRRDIRALRYETDQLRAAVATSAAQLDADRDALLAAQAKLAERRATVEALRQEQVDQFHQLARTKEEVSQLLADQRKQAERLTSRIKGLLEKERHSGRLPSAFNGRLRWPLRGRISQEFGCTGFPLEPAYKDCDHFHRGIDIVNRYGSPVVAAGDGVVLFVGFDPDEKKGDASWSVVIAHSDRLVTTYGHLVGRAAPGIRDGARVREGQVIGWMGNTGKSTGAHLHWGVWFDDEPVNPRYFL